MQSATGSFPEDLGLKSKSSFPTREPGAFRVCLERMTEVALDVNQISGELAPELEKLKGGVIPHMGGTFWDPLDSMCSKWQLWSRD